MNFLALDEKNTIINLDHVASVAWETRERQHFPPEGGSTWTQSKVLAIHLAYGITNDFGGPETLVLPEGETAYLVWRYLHRRAVNPLTERPGPTLPGLGPVG
jgi:hypothetical protein